MLKKIKSFIVNDEELDFEWQKLLSLVFLFIAGAMSFFAYTHQGRLWDTEFRFTPGFISGILGIVLVSPLYLRKILKWNRSIYTIISFVLILLVFASFIELATGGNEKHNVVYSLIIVSIVLTWLGIKGVAGVSWILVLAAAIYSVLVNNLALGFNGFLYVLCGFLGLIMHTGLNPGELYKELKAEYSGKINDSVEIIKSEVSSTGEEIKEAVSKAAAAAAAG